MIFDEPLLRALNGLSSSSAVALIAIALSSRWMIAVVGLPLLVAFRRERWRAYVAVWLAVGLADVTSSQLIKPWVDRERPCRAIVALEAPVSCGPGRSFPSSHAANAFALVTASIPTLGAGALWILPVAVGIAASRVVLGVHYPSDVLAGALLGALIGWIVGRVERRLTAPTTPPSIDPQSPIGSAPRAP